MKTIIMTIAFATSAAIASPTPNPTEGQIAEILLTVNDLEVKAANIAAEKASTNDIRKLAKEIIKDHERNTTAIKKVLAKNKIKAEDSVTKKILEEDFTTYYEDLNQKSGARFDLSYIYHEVSFHEAMIASIDETLSPNAKNGELRNILTDYRALQKRHLLDAKAYQAVIDTAPNRNALPNP